MAIIILRLAKISYRGDSIGREIEVSLSLSEGKTIHLAHRIQAGSEYTPLNELVHFSTSLSVFPAVIDITITEHDVIFSDSGTARVELSVVTDADSLSEHIVEVLVIERRLFFWKRIARFLITLETDVRTNKRIPTQDDPLWTGDFSDDSAQMILARAIFGEARGAKDNERIAVAWSIRNRLGNPRRFGGGTYHAVILKSKQYSAFLESDHNRPFVENPIHTGNALDLRAWEECYAIAGRIIQDEIEDPTEGADHYHDKSIPPPSWAKEEYFKINIGPFRFYAVP